MKTTGLISNFARRLLALWIVTSSLAWTSARCATLLVYNNNDSGAGSLRQAIADNKNLGGGNTIIFSNIVTGTITLTTGELFISNNVTILGPGANVLAVDGNAAGRVFHFTNVTATVSELTISNGNVFGSGGGILNDQSTLTVNNCTLSGNSANTAGTGGGAIISVGAPGIATLNVVGSTFSDNSGINGGGIFNYARIGGTATLTVTNCTFSGNSGSYGGAIQNYGAGGIGALTIIASTFSGNSVSSGAGSAVYNIGSTATLNIGDTILKSAAPSETNIFTLNGGSVTSLGYNLCNDNGGGFLSVLGDQINTDPLLGQLQYNGGSTPTHLPLAGSPAVDQGKNFSFLAIDQRARPRTNDYPATPNATLGDGSDIGAVEVGPFSLIVSNTNDSGVSSLRQAIVDAAPGDTITFATNVTGQITLTSGQLVISKNLTLLGPGPDVLAVSGNNSNRVFYVSGAAAVNICGLTISSGTNSTAGGGILNDHSTLTISNCTLSANSTAGSGGCIYNAGASGTASLSLISSSLIGNSAGNGGGVCYNDGNSGNAVFTIANCILSSNSAYNAGAILNDGFSGHAVLTINRSTLSGNSALNAGGAIDNYSVSGNASLAITNCTLVVNSGVYGGAILNDGNGGTGLVLVVSSTLNGNSASAGSGGIHNNTSSTLSIGNTILKSASGASLLNQSGTVTSLGYNLSSDNGGNVLTNSTDQINTDPGLGPFQNNGGPTFTCALLSNSPAMDMGKCYGAAIDQRGAPRPYDFVTRTNANGGDGSDIGAFEMGRPALNIQNFASNAVLSWPSYYGDYTLQSVTNLSLPNFWTAVAGSPAISGNQYLFTNGPITGNTFYRLKAN